LYRLGDTEVKTNAAGDVQARIVTFSIFVTVFVRVINTAAAVSQDSR
jgi:hypothetical protein